MRAILKEDLHTNDRLVAHAGDEIEVDNIGDDQNPLWIYDFEYSVDTLLMILVQPNQIQVLRD